MDTETITLTRERLIKIIELAWAAGFFDGEGYIGCKADGSVRLSIDQIHKTPLERFQKAVELGSIIGPNPPSGIGKNWQYDFELNCQKAITAFRLIEPYLCEIKLEQGLDAIIKSEIIKASKPNNQPYEHGTCRMYKTKKCRCNLCKEAWRLYTVEYRRRPGSTRSS